MVFRYDSPLFFANAEDFLKRARAAIAGHPETHWFLVNVEAVSEVDITGLDALSELHEFCSHRGIRLGLVRAKSELLEELRRHGFLSQIGDGAVYQTTAAAISAFRDEGRN